MTMKQKAILEYIKKFSEKEGYAPSFREVAIHFGVSIGTIQDHCDRLKSQQVLIWKPSKARTFKVLGGF